LEESAVVCRYLDHLDSNPKIELPDGEQRWEALRLGALASSLMDGLSVWLREVGRPRNEQSPTVIRHETERAGRLIDCWEAEIGHPWMQGKLCLAQIALACALGIEARNPDFRWRESHPTLGTWFDRLAARPSIAMTAPPTAH
jgi:glutathione S-transferase